MSGSEQNVFRDTQKSSAASVLQTVLTAYAEYCASYKPRTDQKPEYYLR